MKNWYGVLGGRRNRLHQNIDTSIADLATFMRPTLVVVDAMRVLMRNGPQGGNIDDTRDMHTVIATVDQVAADAFGVHAHRPEAREPAVPRRWAHEARPRHDALGEPPGEGGVSVAAARSRRIPHAGVRSTQRVEAGHDRGRSCRRRADPVEDGRRRRRRRARRESTCDRRASATRERRPSPAAERPPTQRRQRPLDGGRARLRPPVAARQPKPKKSKLPGSRHPRAPRSSVVLKWARRFAQVFFFALFMYFLFQTGFRGSFAAQRRHAGAPAAPGRGVPARRSVRRAR